MKLVKTIKLYFQEGSSNKVYEVDLCEVDDGLFLVNFRYGRIGTALKEGTKTVFPVSAVEAEKVFGALVNEKRKKGYSEGVVEGFKPEPAKKTIKDDSAGRDKTILKYLKQAKNDEYEGEWEISRIIWRAGELGLQEAAGAIIALCDTDDEYILYAACFALGRFKNPEAIPVLKSIFEKAKVDHLKRFAIVALMNTLAGQERKAYAEILAGNLPIGLKSIVIETNSDTYQKQVKEFIFDEQNTNKLFLWHLYVLSLEYEFIRPKLIEAIKEVPLKSNYFKPVRHIFKAAELLNDKEVLGIMAYRFAKTVATLSADDYYVTIDGEWFNVKKELEKGNHLIAYTKKTRANFNRRILRNLIKAGIEKGVDYVQLATQILLPFSDKKDMGVPTVRTEYEYNRTARKYDIIEFHYDTYSSFITFYYILYKESKRYTLKNGAKSWECISNFKPGGSIPPDREEAFPELWDKAPKEIILLLEKSQAERVHLFANKVYASNPDFEKEITTQNIVNFLACPFETTNKLGLEIAKKVYNPENPSFELVLALINSELSEARLLAMTWILGNQQLFFNNQVFLSDLICTRNEDVRNWLKLNFPKYLSSAQQLEILSIVFEKVKLFEGEDLDLLLAGIGDLVVTNLAEGLRNISGSVLDALFAEPKDHLLIFAGKMLLVLENIEEKSAPYLAGFLQSENKVVRQTGLEILGKFSEKSLLDKSAMLASFCISQLEDVRKSVRPIIQKLVNYNKNFAIGLINSFINIFVEKEPYEGLHEDLHQLFEDELIAHCADLPKPKILKLLGSNFQHAQLLGTSLFKKYIDINGLEMSEIVVLANSDVLEIRGICQKYFENNIPKVKYDKSDAIKLLDAKWQDTREFAFDYFAKNFNENDWEPDLLIRICDSVKHDVQLFGRKMVMNFFKSDHSEEYLVKLGQHPSQNLQLFTSNYIEQYASGKPQLIDQLRFYFKSVLRQINKGSVTKKRAFHFLETESLKDQKVAQITLDILNEVSLTIGKTDKARCLEIMVAIRNKYPEMPSIITEKEFITK